MLGLWGFQWWGLPKALGLPFAGFEMCLALGDPLAPPVFHQGALQEASGQAPGSIPSTQDCALSQGRSCWSGAGLRAAAAVVSMAPWRSRLPAAFNGACSPGTSTSKSGFTVVRCLGQKFAPEGSFMASQGEQATGQGRPEVAELSWNSGGSPFGSVLLVCAVCRGPTGGGGLWMGVGRCGRSDLPCCPFGGLSLGLGSGDGGLDLGWEGRAARMAGPRP